MEYEFSLRHLEVHLVGAGVLQDGDGSTCQKEVRCVCIKRNDSLDRMPFMPERQHFPVYDG